MFIYYITLSSNSGYMLLQLWSEEHDCTDPKVHLIFWATSQTLWTFQGFQNHLDATRWHLIKQASRVYQLSYRDEFLLACQEMGKYSPAGVPVCLLQTNRLGRGSGGYWSWTWQQNFTGILLRQSYNNVTHFLGFWCWVRLCACEILALNAICSPVTIISRNWIRATLRKHQKARYL